MSDFAENFSSPYLNNLFSKEIIDGIWSEIQLLKKYIWEHLTKSRKPSSALIWFKLYDIWPERLSLWNLFVPWAERNHSLIWFVPPGKNPPQSFFAGLFCIPRLLKSSTASFLFLSEGTNTHHFNYHLWDNFFQILCISKSNITNKFKDPYIPLVNKYLMNTNYVWSPVTAHSHHSDILEVLFFLMSKHIENLSSRKAIQSVFPSLINDTIIHLVTQAINLGFIWNVFLLHHPPITSINDGAYIQLVKKS